MIENSVTGANYYPDAWLYNYYYYGPETGLVTKQKQIYKQKQKQKQN